jgi:hypothetical protein
MVRQCPLMVADAGERSPEGKGGGMIVYIVVGEAEGNLAVFTDKPKADEYLQATEQENPTRRYGIEMWEVEE